MAAGLSAAFRGKIAVSAFIRRTFVNQLLLPTIMNHKITRLNSSDKPISRFPVPDITSLPEDIQETMKEVEEKVCVRFS